MKRTSQRGGTCREKPEAEPSETYKQKPCVKTARRGYGLRHDGPPAIDEGSAATSAPALAG